MWFLGSLNEFGRSVSLDNFENLCGVQGFLIFMSSF